MKIKRTTLPKDTTVDYAVLFELASPWYRAGLPRTELADLVCTPSKQLHEPLHRLLSHGLIEVKGRATYVISARGQELWDAQPPM